MPSEESKPLPDTPTPPFIIFQRALEETLYEVKHHCVEKRESGTPLHAIEALTEVQTSFDIVFEANRRYFSKEQHAKLDELKRCINDSIAVIKALSRCLSFLFPTWARDERLAIGHFKNGLDEILADAQKKFV